MRLDDSRRAPRLGAAAETEGEEIFLLCCAKKARTGAPTVKVTLFSFGAKKAEAPEPTPKPKAKRSFSFGAKKAERAGTGAETEGEAILLPGAKKAEESFLRTGAETAAKRSRLLRCQEG